MVIIARYAGHAAGATATGDTEAPTSGGRRGVLSGTEARTLEEAYEVFATLRLEHQATQLQAAWSR